MIKKIAKQLLPPIIFNLLRSRSDHKGESFYNIEGTTIKLPPGHTLPKYQAKHKLFDRFLPVMAKYVDAEKMIIDIGANVGDTAIMMHHHTDAKILCVEPSDRFYPYMVENLGGLDSEGDKFSIRKALVGTGNVKGILTHYDGSAKVVSDERSSNGSSYMTLDALVGTDAVGFIKVDTDGYDHDVLNSGLQVLKRDLPILFWENQIDNAVQSEGYAILYKNLRELGYDRICVFDNFGGLMFVNVEFGVLKSLNEYILNMKLYKTSRTMYFTDVLAYCAKDAERVMRAVEDYKDNWIKR